MRYHNNEECYYQCRNPNRIGMPHGTPTIRPLQTSQRSAITVKRNERIKCVATCRQWQQSGDHSRSHGHGRCVCFRSGSDTDAHAGWRREAAERRTISSRPFVCAIIIQSAGRFGSVPACAPNTSYRLDIQSSNLNGPHGHNSGHTFCTQL